MGEVLTVMWDGKAWCTDQNWRGKDKAEPTTRLTGGDDATPILRNGVKIY